MKSSPMSDHTPDGTGNGSSRPVGSARVHGVLDVAAHVGEVEVALEAVERALHSFVSILMHDSEDLQKQREDGRIYSRPSNVTRPSVTAHGAPRVPAAISSRMATRAGWPTWSRRRRAM